MAAIGFVGLGTMGALMARRLVDAGHDVTVWNRTASKTAALAAEGARVTGFTTCNNLFGGYDAPGGGRLRLTELATTKMACVDPALAQQEQRLMGVLRRVERFSIAADTLTVFDATGPLARFVAEQSR